MTTSAKIRLLLALLFASLLLTALIVQNTYTPKNNLYQTGQTLESNLNKKEELVNDVINNKTSFNKLKSWMKMNRRPLKLLELLPLMKTYGPLHSKTATWYFGAVLRLYRSTRMLYAKAIHLFRKPIAFMR